MTGIIITTALMFSNTEPRGPFGTLLNLHVEEARHAYETGGKPALKTVLAKLQQVAQVQVVFRREFFGPIARKHTTETGYWYGFSTKPTLGV